MRFADKPKPQPQPAPMPDPGPASPHPQMSDPDAIDPALPGAWSDRTPDEDRDGGNARRKPN